jgi:hypothetical protein
MRDDGCLGCLNAVLFKQEKAATNEDGVGNDPSGIAGTAAATTTTTTTTTATTTTGDNFVYRSANGMFGKEQAATNDNEPSNGQASAVGTAATTTKSRTENFFFRS